MIVQLRVDDRLIHGQVALVWTKELNTPGIVVANDNAATSAPVQMTLKMATPTGKKLLIRSVDESIKVFNNPKGKDMRMFALTNNIKDALKIAQNVDNILGINVANVGRFADKSEGEPEKLTNTIMVSPSEKKALEELVKVGKPTFTQVIPSNNKVSISSLLK